MSKPAKWVERAARLGYISVGCVYIIAGSMTAAAALHRGGHTASWHDAIVAVSAVPLGIVALLVIALGLFGYGAWGLISAVVDSDRRGSDFKGIALRAKYAASGVVHAAMAYGVARFALTHHSSNSGSDSNARHWTARVMDMPFGRVVVFIGGLALIAYGAAALWRAWEAKLGERLHVPKIPARALLIGVCRFGIAARGIVVAVVGGSLIEAVIHRDPSRTRATKGALQRLAEAPYGRAVLFIVALGLVAYGVYAIVKGRFRTVRV